MLATRARRADEGFAYLVVFDRQGRGDDDHRTTIADLPSPFIIVATLDNPPGPCDKASGQLMGAGVEYYRQGSVTVDQDFARFGSKSYAINKINTVDVRERSPNGPAVCFIGVFALIVGLMLLFATIWGILVVIGGGVFAYLGWKRLASGSLRSILKNV